MAAMGLMDLAGTRYLWREHYGEEAIVGAERAEERRPARTTAYVLASHSSPGNER